MYKKLNTDNKQIKISKRRLLMGDKLNHRRKNKEVREYKELDISQFDDIIKKPQKPKFDKSKKNPNHKNKKHDSNKKQDNQKESKDKKPNNNKPKDKQRPKQNNQQKKQQNKKPSSK